GNGNNFLSERQCLLRCGEEGSISQTEMKGFVQGMCLDSILIKEPEDAFCSPMEAVEAIQITLRHRKSALLDVVVPREPLFGNLPSHMATLRRFYFDEKQGCKLFVFGGCQGNENNFETMEDCIRSCGGPNEHGVSEFINQLQLQEQSSGSSTNLAIPSGTPINVCSLPKDFGNCMTVTSRYYYDRKTNSCKKFRYSGCGGNSNNFRSGEGCIETCGGLLEKDNRISALTLIACGAHIFNTKDHDHDFFNDHNNNSIHIDNDRVDYHKYLYHNDHYDNHHHDNYNNNYYYDNHDNNNQYNTHHNVYFLTPSHFTFPLQLQ
ncbi:Papilinlike, partial [Caligus rogercresseyi]